MNSNPRSLRIFAAVLAASISPAFAAEAPIPLRILEGHKGSVLAVEFSSDGRTLASSSRDHTIKFWEVASGKLQRTLTEHSLDVYGIVYSPKGDLLASCSGDKTIRLWNAKSLEPIRTLEGHTDVVRAVAFSPDQSTLASVSLDQTARLWDVASGKLRHTLRGHTARVKSVVFARDGTWIATAATDRTIRIWDTRSGAQKAMLEGHTGDIETLALSPDGKLLASSSGDTTIRIWDLATAKTLRTLEGHTAEVDSVAFFPDGRRLASGSKDTTIKLWDAASGRLLRTITGHTGRIESLAFSPDGKTIASGGGGGDTSIRLWEVNERAGSAMLKTEHFDRDPGWDAHHNRIVPEKPLIVTQDFGYSATNFAGRSAGEVGGRIQRSTTPAYFAAALSPAKTLDDKFSASGSFAITTSEPGAGIFFGFFHSQQPGGSGRPIGSLGLDFDFEGKGGRLATRLITSGNKSCGTFATPYLPGKFRPTPLKNDGTRYRWTLDYDPQGAGGHGQFTFTMRSDTHTAEDYGPLPEASQQEAQARFPNTKTFTVPLTPGFKKEGATFDRFGVLNMMKSGGVATMFFDDVQIDGRAQDFAKDPGWIGTGNRTTYEDREVTGAHDFGFSATSHAGGTPGEVGGGLWRSGEYGYYGDRIGPLDLEQRLEARGKVKLVTAGPDSDMHLGWFSSASKDRSPDEAGNFVGIHVGGPTRIGHYFIPQFATAKATKGKVDQGPVLTPGRLFDWSLVYDPVAQGGLGELRVTLGAESATLALKPGQKKEGAALDRFGLFTSQAGGQMVKIFLDDLSYTATP